MDEELEIDTKKPSPLDNWSVLKCDGLSNPRKIILLAVLIGFLTVIWISDFNKNDIFQIQTQTPSVIEDVISGSVAARNISEPPATTNISKNFIYKVPPYNNTFKNPCFYNDDGELQCLPYAFLLGMPKCGTTDLFQMLVKHPKIERTPKEPHWWTRRRFAESFEIPLPLTSYLKMYTKASYLIEKYPDHIIIDASASTLWDNNYWSKPLNFEENPGAEPVYTTAHYIHQILPDTKFLLILRNPTDRLYSDYLYFHRKTKPASNQEFDRWATQGIDLMTRCIANYSARSCVYNAHMARESMVRLRIGMYHIFLEDWFKVFPSDRFLVFRLDDYHDKRSEYMQNVAKFLDIGKYEENDLETVDSLPQKNSRRPSTLSAGEMLKTTRKKLQAFYQPYNDQLAKLLKNSRFRWL